MSGILLHQSCTSRMRKVIQGCLSVSRVTALLGCVVVALLIVVLHSIMAGCVAILRTCAHGHSNAIEWDESADHSQFATAIVYKDTLIVLSANGYFAGRYGRTTAELIVTRFPPPIAKATVALRALPASASASTHMRAIHKVIIKAA